MPRLSRRAPVASAFFLALLGPLASSCFHTSISVLPPDMASPGSLGDLPFWKSYRSQRVSSYDKAGGNDDGQWKDQVQPGETRILAELEGPGAIHHIWVTINSDEEYHLRKIVFKIYWDGNPYPSVLAPIGDFFGTGHGEYTSFVSLPIAIGEQKALNCFWLMPFKKSAKVEITNEGSREIKAFYYYVDYRKYANPAPLEGAGYFCSHYRQQFPCKGFKKQGQDQFSKEVNETANLSGEGNYVILDLKGRGHYVGVVQHILQNDDQWWGEGDDMFFIDGAKTPTLNGTGSEDYYCGAWCFGKTYSYPFFGNPRNDYDPKLGPPKCDQSQPQNRVGARWTVYRFHVVDPVPFEESIRVTMEHGHANSRSDDVATTAYWYQFDPQPLPDLPSVSERLPRGPKKPESGD